MAAPTLVIGVGGTGVRVLLRIKERFLEAYDEVPSNVTLLPATQTITVTPKMNSMECGLPMCLQSQLMNRLLDSQKLSFITLQLTM